ncbi:acylneuraminate cytidylyltransferase family protein [Helicobacter sp. 11S02629-2]|uniref:acylneuraminate cytidylyltransferase family protein n=1 Tax=Helicobacter sp. 11S02629-2 TaxID=1476195 RepID=UPI000BA6BA10|nr:acylneuraminate cytidylyltransferase family protein [Helicobacter sp. 11S02629-2]PAF42408.1 hypothetical protein BKH40_07830 [Helicobacter sp. 11S02629-2]
MTKIAIIPSRAGSKRFKRKNIYPFLGVSMLERSIRLAASVCNLVVVSSDDKEMLDLTSSLDTTLRDEGFKGHVMAYKRSPELSGDDVPTLPVIVDVLQAMKEVSSLLQGASPKDRIYSGSLVVCLYPTAVLCTKTEILKALDLLLDSSAKSGAKVKYVASVYKAKGALRSFKLENGFIDFLHPEYLSTQSQDLPSIYMDAGQFYIGRVASFLEEIPLLGKETLGYEVKLAQDIDTYEDYKIAELKLLLSKL